MSHGLTCIWCGTKGGFANDLIIHRTGDDAIIECRWCSLGAVVKKGA